MRRRLPALRMAGGEYAKGVTVARCAAASCRAAASRALRCASALRTPARLAFSLAAVSFTRSGAVVFLIGRTGTPGDRQSSHRRVSSRRDILRSLAIAVNQAPQSGQTDSYSVSSIQCPLRHSWSTSLKGTKS